MDYVRRNVCGGKYAILAFSPADGEVLTDTIIRETMAEEGLRRITPNESLDYAPVIKARPTVQLVMFDNIAKGPSDRGGFAGHVSFDTAGEMVVIENWTRGHSGEDWPRDLEFMFAAITPVTNTSDSEKKVA
jgi:hypothetical protein